MILDEATHEAFNYWPRDLKLHSNKHILVTCELCGKFRIVKRNNCRYFCNSCSVIFGGKRKGVYRTEETKALISKNHADVKGENNPMFDTHRTGRNNPNYKDGKKAVNARQHSKRRGLGHTSIYPVEEGEDEHHFTNEHVGGIPADVHQSMGGGRKKHRTKVLQWLKANDKKKYIKVLCILAKELLY